MNYWIKNKYIEDIHFHSEFKNELKEFYEEGNKSKDIQSLLSSNIDEIEYTSKDWSRINSFENPILPKNYSSNMFKILEWSNTELARQLTIITHFLYRRVNTRELINSQWTKVDKLKFAPNVTILIERFNKLSNWVCEEILSYDSSKLRAYVIEKFLGLAVELKNINNFNDCLIIITALNSLQIKSLSKSWRRITFENVKNWKDLNNMCSFAKNYATLRKEIESNKDKPCIPYLGLFLKELAFIDEGIKYIKDKNLINLEKIRKVGKVLENFMHYKKLSYNFKPVFKLAFLTEPTPLSEDELTEISSKLEPNFSLSKTKRKDKRFSKSDSRFNSLNDTFNEFLKYHNRNQPKSIKDVLKDYFK